MSPEDHFVRELELFRSDVTSALQCLYAWLAIHHTASKDRAVFSAVDATPLFWNTVLGSLQATCFISMGRIFDGDTRNHSLNRLLAIMTKNPNMFSRRALAARKRATIKANNFSPRAYAAQSSPLTKQDIYRIRRFVTSKKNIYKKSYAKIRHQVFAHKAHGDEAKVATLFSKTKIRELEVLLLSLNGLHETLWQLFNNGYKKRVLIGRHSIKSILRGKVSREITRPAHELVAAEAHVLLCTLPAVVQQLVADGGS